MKFAYISKIYVDKWGKVYSLADLDAMFKNFQQMRPTVYRDFRVWIDNLTSFGLISPF